MAEDERIDQFADDVQRRLACEPREAARRREELVEHLRDAAEAGALDEALTSLGSPEQAAAAFARELAAPDASFERRIGAALVDNLPLIGVSVALAVQGLVGGNGTLLAFPPHAYLEIGDACVSTVPGGGCGEYTNPGLLYAIGMPLALAWSILVLGILESRFGGSPAKLLFGLRVVTEDGLRIRPAAGVIRRLSFLLGPLAWIDWVPFLAGRRRRLLDHLAATRVVMLPRAAQELPRPNKELPIPTQEPK
jgi:uncharacterized RDD family membrane protein YckC